MGEVPKLNSATVGVSDCPIAAPASKANTSTSKLIRIFMTLPFLCTRIE